MGALAAGARSILGRAIEGHELESFTSYLNLLRKWQRVHRLVGSVESRWVVDNLFLDSLLFLRVLPSSARSVADIGSGAGVPGIPIKIVRPDMDMVLIESRQRRVSFLSTAIRELGLTRIRVLDGRVEDLRADTAGPFDAVMMRCAGDTKRLLGAAKALVVSGGIVILSGPPAGRGPGEWEVVEVPGAIKGSTRRFLVHRVARLV